MTTGEVSPEALAQDLVLAMRHLEPLLKAMLALLQHRDDAPENRIAALSALMERIAAGLETTTTHLEALGPRMQAQEAGLTRLSGQVAELTQRLDREASGRADLQARIDALLEVLTGPDHPRLIDLLRAGETLLQLMPVAGRLRRIPGGIGYRSPLLKLDLTPDATLLRELGDLPPETWDPIGRALTEVAADLGVAIRIADGVFEAPEAGTTRADARTAPTGAATGAAARTEPAGWAVRTSASAGEGDAEPLAVADRDTTPDRDETPDADEESDPGFGM